MICRFVLISEVNLVLVFLNALQIAGLSLQPAFDSVQALTSVLVGDDAGVKVTVPETLAVLASESAIVVPEKLCTVAPEAIPVPDTVIPAATPSGFATVIVFRPIDPVAEVDTAELPPKLTVPDTADELGTESVTVPPDTPTTVAPLATPIP